MDKVDRESTSRASGKDNWNLVYTLAGVLRLNPDPFPLSVLMQMYEAYRLEAWNHTAMQMTLYANTKGSKKYSLEDFHPLLEKNKTDLKSQLIQVKNLMENKKHVE